jgi:hypothetical protein
MLSANSEREFAIALLKLEKIVRDGKASSLKVSGLHLRRSFNDLFLEAVDETLASLGDSCKQAIYFHLENSFKIKRQDIPSKVEEFAKAIESIFGFGAKLIEIQIMKCLHEKIGGFKYFPKDEKLSFTQYAAAVRGLRRDRR